MSTAKQQPADIAVIGLGMRLPGADNLPALMQALAEGRVLTSEVEAERWSAARYLGDPRSGDHTVTARAGFIEHADRFDAAFFAISPREAASMDPQQRLALELAWAAIEDANYPARQLAGSRTGVFMGVAHADYAEMMERDQARNDAYLPTGTAFSIVANRISYFFDLRGPSIVNDTACSSSLVSIYEAVTALAAGDCDLALAGGVNLAWSPKLFVSFSKAGMLSKTGTAHAFDTAANGFVRGEGGAVLLLKPLGQAEADGDLIYAVIKGAGTNHGGRTSSLTVTNADAQADLIERVHTRAGIAPDTVGYIEAHGTGTPVGDPIEALGLKRAFARMHRAHGTTARARTCGIGSVKTNIGHLESAAGVAGVLKVIGAFADGVLPGTANFTEQNPLVDLADSPFYIVSNTQPWTPVAAQDGRPLPRRAGVSSFGFGGTNAHIVLEEYPSQATATATESASAYLVPLSAKTAERLRAVAATLLARIDADGVELTIADIANTLRTGRESLSVRVAFVASGTRELAASLTRFVGGELTDTTVHGVDAPADHPAADWVAGRSDEIDDAAPARAARPLLRLPTYPFARDRHWFAPAPRDNDQMTVSPHLHPLLHRNASRLHEHRYETTFSPSDPLLAAHVVNDRPVLPAVAYLEMVRAAVREATEASTAALSLRDTSWLKPLVLDGDPVVVTIALSASSDPDCVADPRIGFVVRHGDTVHASGTVEPLADGQPERIDLAAIRDRCTRRRRTGEVYDRFTGSGLRYGRELRGLRGIAVGEGELLARIIDADRSDDAVVLPPGVLDPAFQASVALLAETAGDAHEAAVVPFVAGTVDVLKAVPAHAWAWVRCGTGQPRAGIFDIDVTDGDGTVCVRIRGLVQRSSAAGKALAGRTAPEFASGAQKAADHVVTATTAWTEIPARPVEQPTVHLLVAGSEPAVERIARSTAMVATRLPDIVASRVADGVTAVIDAVLAQLLPVVRSSPRVDHRFLVVVDDRLPRHFHAALTGLFATVAHESVRVTGRVVRVADLHDADSAAIAGMLHDEAATGGADTEVRYGVGRVRQVLRPVDVALGDVLPPAADGVYWVTGGLGGIGRHLATAFPRGATMVLSGRSAPGEKTASAIDALRAGGVDAHYLQVDVADAAAVRGALTHIVRDHGKLTGVVHAAGVLRDQYLLHKDVSDVAAVLAPKIHGAVNLDAALRDTELEFFVLFSSVAGVYGNPGQGDYAAANSFLDAFAVHRRSLVEVGERSGHTVAISWPLWDDGGMAVDDVTKAAVRKQRGWEPLPSTAGFRVLEQTLADGPAHVVVAYGAEATLALEGRGWRTAPDPQPARAADTGGQRRAERMVAVLTRMLADVLGQPIDVLRPGVGLIEYGIDSLAILDVTSRLEDLFGPLPKTLFFEYLTIDEVAAYLVGEHAAAFDRIDAADPEPARDQEPIHGPAPLMELDSVREPAMTVVAEPARDDRHDIAIIGVSGRYPGAETADDLWELLAQGRDMFRKVPRDRWDHEAIYSRDRADLDRTVIRTGTFLDDVDRFDPRYFRVSKTAADAMAPEVRLFLEVGVAAFEDAGYSRETIHRRYQGDVGVLVGTMTNNYGLYGFQNALLRGSAQSAGYSASVPNMLSYFYGLTGPSMIVDTMCSASSACVHQAVQMLRAGDCKMVLAGGVSLLLHPYHLITSSQEHFTTATSDVIHSFGEGVDGTILGEGAGAVLLKPLVDAERDGDHVYAVIKGSALTNAGARNGFTVPSPRMQARAIEKAMADAGVDPRAISYVEGHGSGTSLGDPIEVTGLTSAFRQQTVDTGFCALGSVKSNVGHLLAAAGVVGITKVLLQMKHGAIAPSLHSPVLNPDIPFDSTPFRVQRELCVWERPTTTVDGQQVVQPRLAGITSIGAGGVNSHIVLAEYLTPSSPDTPLPIGPQLFVFSAMDETALERVVRRFRDFLAGAPESELASIAHTLRVGRNELPCRWAFLAEDRAGALAVLDRYLAGDPDRAAEPTVSTPLGAAGRSWTDGGSVDWDELAGPKPPRRTALPGYPFERTRCWVEADPDAPSVLAPQVFRDRLHPFLGRNISDVRGLRFGGPLRLDDLRDYTVEHDGSTRLVSTFAIDTALAAAAAAGLGTATMLTVDDLRLLAPVDRAATGRLITTVTPDQAGGCGGEIVAGDGVPIVRFRISPRRDVETAALDRRQPDVTRTLSAAELLAELAEGGLAYTARKCGVTSVDLLADGGIVLAVAEPEYRQDHVRAGVTIASHVLVAIAQGLEWAARRAGMARWADFAPRTIGAIRVLNDAAVTHARLALRPVADRFEGTVRLLDEAGRVVVELDDVVCTPVGQHDAPVVNAHRTSAVAASSLVATVSAPADPDAVGFVRTELRDLAAEIVGYASTSLDFTSSLYDFGFDSVNFVRLARIIGTRFGIELSPATFFEFSTLDTLARHLVDEHGLAEAVPQDQPATDLPGRTEPIAAVAAEPAALPEPPWRPAADMPIAIIGAAGRFPGAPNLDAYWSNLLAGHDCVTEFPIQRYADGPYADVARNADFPHRAGVLDDIDAFDAGFFRIYPREAELMDPQHRLVLETVWATLEDAAYRPADLDPDTGVFLGVSGNDYASLLGFHGVAPDGFTATGNSHAVLANRVSYLLDVHGPSSPVDTACSSSLVAVHRAVEAIRAGSCGMALAGGVNVLLSAEVFQSAHHAGMLSPDGRCKTFDATADGYVRSEGIGVVLLKPLAAAERDGDAVLAVIRGSAENHNGRAASLTAPNAEAQARLVAAAMAGIDPDTIGYIETHGTGTALGDPAEIRGLRAAFRKLGAGPGASCALGSVKPTIGHLEAAAGIAGLLKVLLAVRHGVIPGTPIAGELNPYIEFADGPFRIVEENEPWKPVLDAGGGKLPRRAGVSSFGFGGANAHVVVEEYMESWSAEADDVDAAATVVPLSADSDAQLRRIAGALADELIREGRAPAPLASIGWTLQVGRDARRVRTGWLVRSRAELVDRLRRYAAGSVDAPPAVTAPARSAEYDALTSWLEGKDVDWQSLYGTRSPHRLHLPTYPFARDRHWIPGLAAPGSERPGSGHSGSGAPASPDVHPQASTELRVPVWVAPSGRSAPAGDRLVIMVGAVASAAHDVAQRNPDIRVEAVTSNRLELSNRFGELSFHVLELLRGVAGTAFVQIVVPAEGDDALLAALTSLVRTVGEEIPGVSGQIVLAAQDASAAVEAGARHADHEVVRYALGSLTTRRWMPAPAAVDGDLPWRCGGVYLITGGAGGIGAHLAHRIAADVDGPRLVLVGRAAADAGVETLLAQLRAAGAAASYRRADVSRWQEVRHLVSEVRATEGRIDGVVHSAGVLHDAPFETTTRQQWSDVLDPKVDGVVNLDRAIGTDLLDFLITFSSGVAVTGNGGQSGYGVANAFLDEFAALRTARVERGERAGRTLSVAWPLWADGGMIVSDAVRDQLRVVQGLEPMPADVGLAALAAAWRLRAPRVWIYHGNMERVGATAPKTTPVESGRKHRPAGGVPATEGPATEDPAVDVLPIVLDVFAEVTKLPRATVSPDRPLTQTGLDSFTVAQLTTALRSRFPRVPATLFFDLPDLRTIAEHLAGQVISPRTSAPAVSALAAAPVHSAPTPHGQSTVDEPIAIIGVSGHYPQADDLSEFWANLSAGRDCITEIPAERWSLDNFYTPDRTRAIAEGRSYSKWGGFLHDATSFDPLFFRIAPRDAYAMDPQERLFLQAAWEVVEDAGYAGTELARLHAGRVGVFAGVTKSGHGRHGAARLESGEVIVASTSFASLSARTSFVLDARGPSLTIDTMCSSSLTAVHEACEHLRRGTCDVAIAGGVNVYTHPLEYVELCHSGMLSDDARCRSFGAEATGFVPGEGVGAVLLKPLSRAVADGDRVLAVVRGSSANHGGHANGYTVPRSGAQAQLVREAMDRAGVSARDVSYVEAHGTGTALGDPIEIQGLSNAFATDTDARQFCAIGSAKSVIGHLEAAAGIAGLTKVLLQLRHRTLVPTRHARPANPEIDFAATPFRLQHDLAPWESDGPRTASVSSFGAGGSNAHVIVQEYEEPAAATADDDSPRLVVLSARTPEQLRAATLRLAAAVERGDIALADVAHTLQVGRVALSERLAVVVTSTRELCRTLRAHATGAATTAQVGTADGLSAAVTELARDEKLRATLLQRWAEQGNLAGIAALWVEGFDFDWRLLPGSTAARRVELPTYPFDRRRFWVGDLTSVQQAGSASVPTTQTPSAARTTASTLADPPTVEPVAGDAAAPAPAAAAPAPVDVAAFVAGVVRDVFAQALALPAEDLNATMAFADYGVDSILAVRAAHELGSALNVELPSTILFDHSSVERLTAHLVATHGADLSRTPAASKTAPTRSATAASTASVPTEPIAIVGMSGRFPGAKNLDELWQHLLDGDDLVSAARWDGADTEYPGGFLDEIDRFDPLFFGISAVEAAGMDPQQRLLLEESWKALEDAGYGSTAAMRGKQCGVYVGCWAGDYDGGADAPPQNLWGTMGSVIPGRVAYVLDLTGPVLAVDTSCSSSLVAIDLACQDLRSGRTGMAVAGGVYVQTTPRLYTLAGRAGMLSPTGRCHTFDDRADGFVPGEAVGVVVLKRLADALADGDHVHAVIRGSGVNHDGATNGITAPSSLAQERLLREVYERFAVDPSHIGLVEAHGTGTALGDPIEFDALSRAFRARTGEREFCDIGSVKTAIGHAQFAAGAAALLKVVLAIKYGQVPASLHLERPNAALTLDGSPFRLATCTHRWDSPAGRPRTAVVSAFGASGTNAHLVVEQAPGTPRARVNAPLPAYLVMLSAHSRAQLAEQVARLAAHCRGDVELDCGDVAYTLAVGRTLFPQRFACVVRDRTELLAVLDEGLHSPSAYTTEPGSEPGDRSRVDEALARCRDLRQTADPAAYRADLTLVARAVAGGMDIDCGAIFVPGSRRRTALPTYPFAAERHWARGVAAPRTVLAARAVSAMAGTARRRESLTATDPLIRDHRVQGKLVVPGAVQLELVRRHAAAAFGARDTAPLLLRHVTWVRPLIIEDASVIVDVVVTIDANGTATVRIVSATDPDTVFCQGEVIRVTDKATPRVDLAALRAQCRTEVSSARIEEELVSMGITHGMGLRAVRTAWAGDDVVVAELALPADAPRGPVLHPCLVDSAIQAAVAAHLSANQPAPRAIPFTLDRLELVAPPTDTVWAVLRPSGTGGVVSSLDIDLVDHTGAVHVRMTGYSARHLPTPVPSLVVPAWEVLPVDVVGRMTPGHDDRALVVGGTDEQWAAIAAAHPRAVRWTMSSDASVAEVTAALTALGPIDHLYWLAPHTPLRATDSDGFAVAQRTGVVAAFRMVKALLASGYDRTPFGITLLTRQSLPTSPVERVAPAYAGLHGLFGSVGREYANWTIRRLDLPDAEWPADLDTLPESSDGDIWVRRTGQWLVRRWAPCDATPDGIAYRSGAVYVVIGGAGGLGVIWTRHVLSQVDAVVVWIGRTPRNARIDELARHAGGAQVSYQSADASDPTALRAALAEITAQHGPVHGVVHAALDLRDRSVAAMEESTLLASLAAKAGSSVAMANVFAGQPLEFVIFFSSMQAFTPAAGQSNYAAGSVFADAYAHHLGTEWTCQVTIMNWGWWGGLGSVATDFYRSRMTAAGLVSIEPAEGMHALDTLLTGPVRQAGFIKTSRPDAVPAIEPAIRATARPRRDWSVPAEAVRAEPIPPTTDRRLRDIARWRAEQRDPLLAAVLRAHLVELGAVPADRAPGQGEAVAVPDRIAILDRYSSWLEQSLKVIPGEVPPAGEVMAQWRMQRAVWATDADVAAELALVDAMLEALPHILTGAVRPTDVMFPQGSVELVEGCYRGNIAADTFNRAVVDAVVAVVADQTAHDPGRRVRILEIGAGTGGTSSALFTALEPFAEDIETYTYTDLSQAFLANARRVYAPRVPYLGLNRLDIEKPVAQQGIREGSYDIVVAANVLHATGDIRRALRNTKVALRPGGWLLLNELTSFDLFSHLTFGLLEGWWLSQDGPLRVPGSPALSMANWRAVLEVEGYTSVLSVLPAAAALGQQIIAAACDGTSRRLVGKPVSLAPTARIVTESAIEPDVPTTATAPQPGAPDRLRTLHALAAEVLGIDIHRIDTSVPLLSYGMDSILVLQFTNALRTELDQDISPSVIFESQTLDALCAYLLDAEPGRLEIGPAPAPESARLPLSQDQIAVWRAEPNESNSSVPLLFAIGGELDVAALDQAVGALHTRHPIVAATFHEAGGQPFMVIADGARPRLERCRITESTRAGQLAQLRALADQPMDLATGPLLRAHLVEVVAEQSRPLILLVVHHMIADGTATALLVTALRELYRTAAAEVRIDEETVTEVAHTRFVEWERAMLDSHTGAAHRKYWMRTLAAPRERLELPYDRKPVVGAARQRAVVIGGLAPEVAAAVAAAARSAGVSQAAFFLASYALYLHSVTGTTDVRIGFPNTVRYEGSFADIVGHFVNRLVIRTTIEPDSAFADVLAATANAITSGLEHGALPVTEIQRALRMVESDSEEPINETKLLFQNFTGASVFTDTTPEAPGELNLGHFDDLPELSDAVLGAEVYQTQDRYKIFLKYDAACFDASTARSMLDGWCAVIATVASDLRTSAGGLPASPASLIDGIPGDARL